MDIKKISVIINLNLKILRSLSATRRFQAFSDLYKYDIG